MGQRFRPPRIESPDYSGPPAPSYFGPEQVAALETEPLPTHINKRSPVAVIAGVIVALLACCCVSAALGLILFSADLSETGDGDLSDIEAVLRGESRPGAGADDARSAWDTFDPEPFDPEDYVAPTERHISLLEEITGTLYPGFTVVDAVVYPGWVGEDSYYSDSLHVLAVHSDDPGMVIAFSIDMELEEAWGAGASYSEDALAEDEALGLTGDETEYVYDTTRLPGLLHGAQDPESLVLLEQIARDFPNAVTDGLRFERDLGLATITRWEGYPSLSGGFSVTYERVDGDWQLIDATEW